MRRPFSSLNDRGDENNRKFLTFGTSEFLEAFMMQSLYTAATGMSAQQLNIDTISNNLANVSTTGFKAQRVDFQDLIYKNLKPAGTPTSPETNTPDGLQIGEGVMPVSTQRIFTEGAIQNT